MIDQILETDVLVIGGGGGGLRAAIAAHEASARVLVLSKGIVGKSGLTQTAVTGFQVAFGYADARDNPAVHYADTMRGGYGLADPALVKKIEAAQHALGATTSGDEIAFRLEIERALYSRYKPKGEPDAFPPEYLRWSAA